MSAYDGKTIAEIVHDYAVIRGDLCTQYARNQLVRIIEGRIHAAEAARDEMESALESGDACGAVGCRALAERDRLAGVVAKVREELLRGGQTPAINGRAAMRVLDQADLL